jgi:hypothetical protein
MNLRELATSIYQNLDTVATVIFVIIGLLVFRMAWKYIAKEMKSAPKHTPYQRFRYLFANTVFSGIVAITVAFVLALVTTTFSVNAQYAIIGENTIWNETILNSLAFPRFLPITLMIITAFAIIYPFGEYILLARHTGDSPTDIHRWLENKVIDRVDSPWTYFVAILLFLGIFILVPTGISYITLNYSVILDNTQITAGWLVGLIFAVWLLIGPIFYLSYYSQLGTGHFFHQGLRSRMRVDFMAPILFIVALISIISSIYSFIDTIPILWGVFPEYVADPAQNSGGFLQSAIEFVMKNYLDVEGMRRLRLVFIAIPVDFIVFTITTVFFGLFGFYKKFLSKEPLNKASLVFFAAYLITGIGFSIFVNILSKWPYIFPDQYLPSIGLIVDFSNPTDQQAILRIFSTAIVIEKFLNAVFVIYFVFFNKAIRRATDELILNKAIIKQNLSVVSRFSHHESPEMRLLVVNNILYSIRIKSSLTPKQTKVMIQIIGDLLSDPDINVRSAILKQFKQIFPKFKPEEWVNIFKNVLMTDNSTNIQEVGTLIESIGKQDLAIFTQTFNGLISAKLSENGKKELFAVLDRVANGDWNLVTQLSLPLITQADPIVAVSAFNLIQTFLPYLEEFYPKIVDLCSQLLQNSNQEVVIEAIDVFSQIAAIDFNYIPTFLEKLPQVKMKNLLITRQEIGALARILGSFPFEFERVFPTLENILTNGGEEAKIDFALSLGAIGSNITSKEQFYSRIYPYLESLILDQSISVRRSAVSSLYVIAKTRPDLASDPRLHHLFQRLLIDPDRELRHNIHHFLESQDPETFLMDILNILKENIDVEYRIDLLNHLAEIAPKLLPFVDQYQIIELLMAQDFNKQHITLSGRKIAKGLSPDAFKPQAFTGIENQQENREKPKETPKEVAERYRKQIAAFILDEHAPDHGYVITEEGTPIVISVLGATIAVLTQLARLSFDLYQKIGAILNNPNIELDDLAIAKVIEFHAYLVTHPDPAWKLPFNIQDVLKMIQNRIKEAGPLTTNAIAWSLMHIYAFDNQLHELILEVMLQLKDRLKRPDPNTIKYLLIGMCDIAGDFPDLYFKTGRKGKGHRFSFEDDILPFLKANLDREEPQIVEGWTAAIEKLATTTRQEKQIKTFLLGSLHATTSISSRNIILQAIVKLPTVRDDPKVTDALTFFILGKEPKLKITAIHSIGTVLKGFAPYDKKRAYEYRKFRKLMDTTLLAAYSPDSPVDIKKAILEELEGILFKHPTNIQALDLLKKLGVDSSAEISIGAIQLFFKYLEKYPEQFNATLPFFRHFANSGHIAAGKLLAQQLDKLYQAGKDPDLFLPTLLELASSKFKEVRELALEDFRNIYYGDPAKLKDFFEEILKLARHKDAQIRWDAAAILLDIIIAKSEIVKDHEQIFNTLRLLAIDSLVDVRRVIAEHMYELVDVFPDQLVEILNILYGFMRESDDEILQSMGVAMLVIAQKDQQYYNEIHDNLGRVYKKSQNAKILTIIKELENQAKETQKERKIEKKAKEIKQKLEEKMKELQKQ